MRWRTLVGGPRLCLKIKRSCRKWHGLLFSCLKNKIIRTWTAVSSGPTAAPLPYTPEADPNKISGTLRRGRNTNTQISRSFYTG